MYTTYVLAPVLVLSLHLGVFYIIRPIIGPGNGSPRAAKVVLLVVLGVVVIRCSMY